MSDPISLNKANPLRPAEDYASLRKQGIKYIEHLAGGIWTDYNPSDPGITILEAVCYAITDLAYRSGFEMKDLLAPENLTSDTWRQVFYTARQILHNSPMTIIDYRKLIIDIKGVRNAWIEPSKDYEVPIWVDYNHYEKRKDNSCHDEFLLNKYFCIGKLGVEPEKMQYYEKKWAARRREIERVLKKNKKESEGKEIKVLEEELKLVKRKILISKIVEIEGLYNVIVEYEEDVLEEDQREQVRQQVVDHLSSHRNLCEDFLSINSVEYEDFGIKTSITLEENADPDEVLAQIFFTIYKYFSPSIRFHMIKQMQEKEYSVEEIFNGPPLQHGFIESKELEKTDLFRNIKLSDIINEIADISGIKGVTYLHLPYTDSDEPDVKKNYFYKWIKQLQEERKIARIQPCKSQVMFCKEREFITYFVGGSNDRRPERMLKLFKDLKSWERKNKLKGHEKDFPVPTGEYMELQDYFPVTYTLPVCYGVNDNAGLPPDADQIRKVQGFQLKGYLLFFEQLLADYLVQLNHLRDLFSFDSSVEQTYFTRALSEIKNLKSLLADFKDDDENKIDEILNDFTNILQKLVESPKLFNKRRNHFLNHMLARFGEELSEYEALSTWLTPEKVNERLIQNKIGILKDGEYVHISSNRAKGFDYASSDFWNTTNVSGTERRVGRLLGFENIERRTLAPHYLVTEPILVWDSESKTMIQKVNKKGERLNLIKVFDPDNEDEILLTSIEVKEGCCTELLMNQILVHAEIKDNFVFYDHPKHPSRRPSEQTGPFWFELYDGTDLETAILLASSERFDTKKRREIAFDQLQKSIEKINHNEGLHLVEHILLRPKFDEVLDEAHEEIEVKFLNICLDFCDLGIGLDEETEEPLYGKKIRRIPAKKCYDKMPWVLEYFRSKEEKNILFQKVRTDGAKPVALKFRRYEALTERVKDLQQFGSERDNYEIGSYNIKSGGIKYGFIIYGNRREILAQSDFDYATKEDAEKEIENLIRYFGYQFDLYCKANLCDNNEDPYSFRTTVVLPCWPKRFRDPTFCNLVEKTIQTQSPAQVHTKIVWLGIQEMKRFEKSYFDWLQEITFTQMPRYEIVNPLVEVLNTLIPCGPCDEEENDI